MKEIESIYRTSVVNENVSNKVHYIDQFELIKITKYSI
jgi:hypothetical protein